MIIYPVDEQETMDKILKKHPWSDIKYTPVQYKGKRYNKISSSDLDLLAEVCNQFLINKDPWVSRM